MLCCNTYSSDKTRLDRFNEQSLFDLISVLHNYTFYPVCSLKYVWFHCMTIKTIGLIVIDLAKCRHSNASINSEFLIRFLCNTKCNTQNFITFRLIYCFTLDVFFHDVQMSYVDFGQSYFAAFVLCHHHFIDKTMRFFFIACFVVGLMLIQIHDIYMNLTLAQDIFQYQVSLKCQMFGWTILKC